MTYYSLKLTKKKLARFIANSLEDRGYHVFIDIRMPVGTNWVNRIEDEIKAADLFIVLLSRESIRSEMVRQEVKLAHKFYKDDMTDFMEEAILSQTESPIILLIDEADQVFHMPWRDDFFSTIRDWHNLQATREAWDLLNLVIAHSTEPYLWIRDIHQSPFNVAFQIRLEDFHPGNVSCFNWGLIDIYLNISHKKAISKIYFFDIYNISF